MLEDSCEAPVRRIRKAGEITLGRKSEKTREHPGLSIVGTDTGWGEVFGEKKGEMPDEEILINLSEGVHSGS
jgi:hypothetical protein